MSQYNAKVMLRSGSSKEWELYKNIILLKAEPAIEYEVDDNGKFTSIKLKIGDGISVWSELPYFLNTGNENILTVEDLEKVLKELGYESITEEYIAKLIDTSIQPLDEKINSIVTNLNEINNELARLAKDSNTDIETLNAKMSQISKELEITISIANFAYTAAIKATHDSEKALEEIKNIEVTGNGLSENDAKKLSALKVESFTVIDNNGKEKQVEEVIINCGTSSDYATVVE